MERLEFSCGIVGMHRYQEDIVSAAEFGGVTVSPRAPPPLLRKRVLWWLFVCVAYQAPHKFSFFAEATGSKKSELREAPRKSLAIADED